jgi:transcriptional regulator with XRE-family HTH domain
MNDHDHQSLATLLRICNGDGTFTEARERSGLSLGQTARLAGITRERVVEIESTSVLTPEKRTKLRLLYGVDRFVTPRPAGEARTVLQCLDCHALWCEGEAPRHTNQCEIIRASREAGRLPRE